MNCFRAVPSTGIRHNIKAWKLIHDAALRAVNTLAVGGWGGRLCRWSFLFFFNVKRYRWTTRTIISRRTTVNWGTLQTSWPGSTLGQDNWWTRGGEEVEGRCRGRQGRGGGRVAASAALGTSPAEWCRSQSALIFHRALFLAKRLQTADTAAPPSPACWAELTWAKGHARRERAGSAVWSASHWQHCGLSEIMDIYGRVRAEASLHFIVRRRWRLLLSWALIHFACTEGYFCSVSVWIPEVKPVQ